MASKDRRYELQQDRKGMVWDLLLYVPTVTALVLIGVKMWFGANQSWAYLLIFLGTFFFLIGFNRIAKTRLMLFPGSPVSLEVAKDRVSIGLRSGVMVDVVKDIRFFSEVGGKTIALTGIDASGQKQQYIFHQGQFKDGTAYKDAKSWLEVYR